MAESKAGFVGKGKSLQRLLSRHAPSLSAAPRTAQIHGLMIAPESCVGFYACVLAMVNEKALVSSLIKDLTQSGGRKPTDSVDVPD